MDSITQTSMADEQKLHIVMFPWLAFGHMIPYLELAKLIAQEGHRVSFVSTPRNIARLPKLPPNLSPLINFVNIPLPHVADLPENAEATSDVPFNKVQFLKKAYDDLREPITRFLQNSDPDWVLYDFAPYWLGPIAAKLGVSCAFFSIFIAAFLSFCVPPSDLMDGQDDRMKPEHFTVQPKWIPFPSTVAFRHFEISRIFNEGACGKVSDLYRLTESIRGCDVLAVRSCAEFEPEWLQLLEGIHRKPILPVGQLPPMKYDSVYNDTWRRMCPHNFPNQGKFGPNKGHTRQQERCAEDKAIADAATVHLFDALHSEGKPRKPTTHKEGFDGVCVLGKASAPYFNGVFFVKLLLNTKTSVHE
ncbi:hypothetical protein L1049_018700 [Liquidambar formosana]|uniref:Uncharacterized protein n=1 Tax=Liquidambar formosana TaxID=63359 RepID=A0AAP0RAH5_LIQFO